MGHILCPVTHVTHQSADQWSTWPVTHHPVPDHGMSRWLLTNHDEFVTIASNNIIITVCTVVQNWCKGDEPCQWNTPIFRPSEIRKPSNDRHETWQGWLRRGYHPTCNFGISTPRGGAFCICVKLSSSVSIFYTAVTFWFRAHLYRSYRLTDFRPLWLKRRVSETVTSFGMRIKMYIISTIFSPNNAKFPIPAI